MACENVYRDVCGLHLSYIFQEPVVREALKYKPKPGDVFVVSFPKSGSTWMQQIVYAIYNDGAKPKNLRDFLQKSPFLELVGLEAMENMPRPGAIKTHLPFNRVPYSPQAKYIFVARNPYDCCVSFYHHTRAFPEYRFAEGSFDAFLNAFLRGKVDCGDYFDELLSWYDHIHDDNVLFVTYEKLKSHTSEEVIKVADFLGSKYGEKLRNQPKILERILDTISAKSMAAFNDEFRKWTEKAAEMTSSRVDEVNDKVTKPMNGDFVRKAIVGDWKNHFSCDQIKRMKEKIASKFQGTSVMSLWEHVELP
ncbi:sulfotransferase ssu-1 [Rhipicephalus sanguineus]|uniref:sulfotransferase ssu-1 n=1 Tax=Rhipicephalus sanguineus TaxID=34632 RepID=UPI0018960E1F|nr:sulfotransferase ssu-1 [Rhipicephalus sanguineus]XP_049266943.1 sulfotransferase ssu-1 [Rhipicephalus sanguineus]